MRRSAPGEADFPAGPDAGGVGRNWARTPARAAGPFREFPALSAPVSPEAQVSFASMWDYFTRILTKRKFLIAGSVAVALAASMTYVALRPPIYVATARIQINAEPLKIINGDALSSRDQWASTGSFLKTQHELLLGRQLADRVVTKLQLHERPDFFNSRTVSLTELVHSAMTQGPPQYSSQPNSPARKASEIIRANLSIRPVIGSRLVDLRYSDLDPQRAAEVINAYVHAFVESNQENRLEANVYAKQFLQAQIDELKLVLQKSENALLEFADKAQLTEFDKQASIAEASLVSANTSLQEIVTQRIKSEQLWKQLSATDAIDAPELLANPAIQDLRAKRSALQREYQEQLEIFKPGYPAMVQIRGQIEEVERQLASEARTIRESHRAAFETLARQEAHLRSRTEELRQTVIALQKKSVEHGILKREVDTNRNLHNSLLQRMRELDVASGVAADTVLVVETAQIPEQPAGPGGLRLVLLSLVLGMGGSFCLAYVLELIDDRIRTPEDVEDLAGLPLLGVIPTVTSRSQLEDELADPSSPTSEAYRSLATALQFATPQGLPRSITLTSVGPADGKSSTAWALGRHFAGTGLRVLLIDADLRRPSRQMRSAKGKSIGLSSYLSGSAMPPETFLPTGTANLTLMPSGPLPRNAADLLSGSRFHALVSTGVEVFDLIIVDGPPVLGLADAQLLSSATAATLLLTASGASRKTAFQAAMKRLDLTPANVIGALLTRFDAKANGYGNATAYAYGYGVSNRNRQPFRPRRLGTG